LEDNTIARIVDMKESLRNTFTIGLLLVLSSFVLEQVRAQQPDRPRNSVTIPTDLVVTWAHIFNKKDGSVVKGLEADDLLLREDGNPQRISLLKEDQPLAVVILVKAGYCPPGTSIWSPQWSFHRSPEAIGQLGDDTEVALMAWEADVLLTQPLTRDRQVIADQLSDRNYFKNALWRKQPQYFSTGDRWLPRPGEAVYQAAHYLEQAASPGRRKIIIVLTYPDWTNWTHSHTAAEVKELLEKTGTTVYGLYQDNGFEPGVTLFSKLGLEGEGKRRRIGGSVEEFVEQSGGTIVKGKPEEGDELFIKLAGLIRSAYTIGYYPENSDFDGGFRRISLELSPRGKTKAGKVNIKTRNGYRALRPSQPTISEVPHNGIK
jgi:VWFA-related protein